LVLGPVVHMHKRLYRVLKKIFEDLCGPLCWLCKLSCVCLHRIHEMEIRVEYTEWSYTCVSSWNMRNETCPFAEYVEWNCALLLNTHSEVNLRTNFHCMHSSYMRHGTGHLLRYAEWTIPPPRWTHAKRNFVYLPNVWSYLKFKYPGKFKLKIEAILGGSSGRCACNELNEIRI
jgi:hypothetical protein